MKRNPELFVVEGVIQKKAEPPSYLGPNNKKGSKSQMNPDDYGLVSIDSHPQSPDQDKYEVYTHYQHSFLRDSNGKPIQPEKGTRVFFFLVPLEYLFSDVPGTNDSAPMLAVNILAPTDPNGIVGPFPYQAKKDPNAQNRHPCTFVSTIEPDPVEKFSLFSDIFLITTLILKLFHKKRLYYYGINDYNELTIIDAPPDLKLKPWDKIWLQNPREIFGHNHFRRIYSPKRDKCENMEFKILVQLFDKFDPGWHWKFK